MSEAKSLIDLLRYRAETCPDALAYAFMADGEDETARLAWAEVDRSARAIGALLRELGAAGERVLLLYPQGLEFVAAFYGCLYAGAVAVPAYPPRNDRSLPRIRAILDDCRPRVVLTVSGVLERARGWFAAERAGDPVRWVTTDGLDPDLAAGWTHPGAGPETLAFLQYTSGSTALPRGVMVSHGNLLHNLRLLQEGWRQGPGSVIVSWLPLFHDMGLIGNVLEALHLGAPCHLMAPASFLQRPFRWLAAVSRCGATLSGAPNFAYELAVERTTPAQRATLDLSRWSAAFNGAEPVRADTLERFFAAFAPCGLRREALQPGYGLAEATLVVSAGRAPGAPHTVLAADAAALERGRVAAAGEGAAPRPLVGCGQVVGGQRVEIVDPDTFAVCEPGRIGEIWLAGPSVAGGYWARPAESAETFGARTRDGEGPFLRTGDLGFVRGGELFVAGRAKDLIVIRGRNHYPQDIEATAERASPGLRAGCVAAFPLEEGGEEVLCVAAEVERQHLRGDLGAMAEEVRRAVLEDHDLRPHRVVLLRTGAITRTTSGKIQRRACRAALLAGELEVVFDAVDPAPASPPPAAAAPASGDRAREVEGWLAARIAARARVAPADVDPREPFARWGLDSAAAVSLSGELAEWLGRSLPTTLLYDHPTPARLARFLAGETRSADGSAAATGRGHAREPIAIVGVGCRFPGADGPEAFWRLLEDGADAVGEVPAERWSLDELYDPDPHAPGKMSTRWGGFLGTVDGFDAAFFSVSAREAARMDPQQRLLLETAWEALEDAGADPDALAGSRTGVWIGISGSDYGQAQLHGGGGDPYAGTGSALSIAANRLSYVFDLRGPSLAVDTACSSSLVALHLAVASLRAGECDRALVGGANLLLSPGVTVHFTKGGFMSPTGRCHAFDARADGYVRGEGAGVVVLKPLSRALADGDRVYAVVLGTAVNQDGRSNGLTAPSRGAQEAVLREAYRDAGVPPGAVQYVEAHGTGTALGDPIEASALGAVLSEGRAADRACALGSVKASIGHLEAAAGIAGVVKVALALRHRRIPASPHFQSPNPAIPFDALRLAVQTWAADWPAEPGRALAGVSSFGFGGTNAHAVLADAADDAAATDESSSPEAVLLPISARSPEALDALAAACRDLLRGGGAPALADVAWTAALRRAHHDHRITVAASSAAEAAERIDAVLAGEKAPNAARGRRVAGRAPRIAFAFSGQGSQWWAMGRGLLEREPVFREAVERVDARVREVAGWSVLEALTAGEEASRVDDTAVAQPAIFAVQVGLAALWARWGVRPAAVLGHSVGEVAAAHVAGALTLDDAVRVIVHRGRLMQAATGLGTMAAVGLCAAEAEAAVAPYGQRLSVAAFNSPETCTVSGETEALEALLAGLERRGTFVRRLSVRYAFHSAQMDGAAGELATAAEGIAPRAGAVPFVSTVTGGVLDGAGLAPAYWQRNVRRPVRFAQAAAALLADGFDAWVEIGPHAVLGGALAQCVRAAGADAVILPSLRRGEDDRAVMLGSLGALYARGAAVDWAALHPRGGRLVDLPRYPWQRERFWADDVRFAPAAPPRSGRGPVPALARHVALAEPAGAHLWEGALSAAPAADELRGIARAAARQALGGGAEVGELEMAGDPPAGPVELQAMLAPDAGRHRIRLFARATDAGTWSPLASAAVTVSADTGAWLHEVRWVAAARTAQAEASVAGEWIVVSDDTGVAGALAADVAARGGRCVVLRAGEPFPAETGEGTVRVVHLAGLDASDDENVSGDWGLGAALETARAAARLPVPACLWIATRGAHAVTEGEAPSVRQAALAGFARTLSAGDAARWGGMVDLDPAMDGAAAAAALLGEISAAGDAAADEVAFRGGERQVARLARIAASEPTPLALRPDAAYLVTGGLGDLGLIAARRLVEAGARHLVLAGRTGLPERAAWHAVEPGTRTAGRIAAVRALEEVGARVRVAAVDVGDAAAVEALLGGLRGDGWPELRGVVHAAGVARVGEADAAALAEALAPKAAGALHLDRQLADRELDFFVLFGSWAGVLGVVGQGLGAYGAANAALCALAERRRARGRAALCIEWGDWAGVGMRARAAAAGGAQAPAAWSIDPAEGAALIDRLLGSPRARVAVIPVEWSRWSALFPAAAAAPFLSLLAPSAPPAAAPEREARPAAPGVPLREALLAAEGPARAALLEGRVREVLGRILGVSAARVEVDVPVTRLGMDSLMAAELRARIEAETGAAVSLAALLGGPSIRELAASVLVQLSAAAVAIAPVPDAASPEGDEETHPTSRGQRALWFLHQVDPGGALLNVMLAARIDQAVDFAALRRTAAALLERHPALRTGLVSRGALPELVVRRGVEPDATLVFAEGWTDAEVAERAADEGHRPFDLERGPLLRVTLFRRAAVRHVLLLAVHHAATDFWSNAVIVDELLALYGRETGADAAGLAPATAPFTDFVRWQEALLGGPDGERLWSYWRGALGGEPEPLALPADRAPAPGEPARGAGLHLRIGGLAAARVRGFAAERGTTPFVVLLAAWQALLHRYTGNDEVVVASPAAGRTRAGYERTVGYFMNPVLVRGDLSGAPSFAALVERARAAAVGALEHQDYPLPLLAERLRAGGDPGRPLFQAMFVLNRPHRPELRALAGVLAGEAGSRFEHGGVALESLPLEERTAVCELALYLGEVEGGAFSGRIQYDAGRFDPATVRRMAAHLQALLDGALAAPAARVADLPLLDAGERLCALYLARGDEGPAVSIPVHRLLEAQAVRTPDAPAVVSEDERATYAEVNAHANRLARRLRALGAGPDVPVGICLERSVDQVVAIFAALKAGAAYLPLDPAYPAERLAFMLADAKAPLLVTGRGAGAGIEAPRVRRVELDAEAAAIAAEDGGDLGTRVDGEQVAAVIYTSGSTGRPKGVMVRHAALANHTASAADAYGITAADRVLQFASASFDASAEEIFPALARGAVLVLRPEWVTGTAAGFLGFCAAQGVTVLDLPTAYWHQLVASMGEEGLELPPAVRLAILGGERALPERAAAWLAWVPGRVRLVNSYGPTEGTVVATRHEVAEAPAGRELPIGRAIRGVRAHVLDVAGEPVPRGLAGALFLAGAGLARGYLGHPALTAARFVPDSFSGEPGARMYATGDRARHRADGALEFLGRMDGQVKIRGFRVEPGEVEGALARHPDLRGVAVAAREDAPGQRRLVAYVVAAAGAAPTARELRGFLKEQLPEYMLPAAFVFLTALPLNASGKVDRRALPAPGAETGEAPREHVPPRTPAERVLADAWAGVLGVPRMGVHDSFFELGGDSILAIQAIARAAAGGVRVTPRMLFTHPTVAELAAQAPFEPAAPPAAGAAAGDAAAGQAWTPGEDAGGGDDPAAALGIDVSTLAILSEALGDVR